MESEFLDAIEGLRATAASPSAYEVVEALDRHGREEGELLERYRRFVDESESPAVRYLVRLVLEDEERHHRVLEDLANTIAWAFRCPCTTGSWSRWGVPPPWTYRCRLATSRRASKSRKPRSQIGRASCRE